MRIKKAAFGVAAAAIAALFVGGASAETAATPDSASSAVAAGVPKIAVYVFGAEDPAINKAMCTRLIAALANTGRYRSAEGYKEFFEQMAAAKKGGSAPAGIEEIGSLGKQFGVKYVCVAEMATILGESQITARIYDVETGETEAIGVADSPLKTLSDIAGASEAIVAALFRNALAPQTAPPSQAEVPSDAVSTAPAAVTVTRAAKEAVDRVAAAVNAFKDATAKSLDAANAVKTATQSKNFSAIMDAKKKVTAAGEALKKAKEDVTVAMETLKTAGPEAEAAAKALGIDLAMFAGKGKDGAAESGDNEAASGRRVRNGFTLGYYCPYRNANVFQTGFAQARPVAENLSFVWEANIWGGRLGNEYFDFGEHYGFVGVNFPLLCQFDARVFSAEAGAQLDMIRKIEYHDDWSGGGVWVFNIGLVVGGGFSFDKARMYRLFYRFCYGTAYYSSMMGIRFLF
jgi:hypothetical protein